MTTAAARRYFYRLARAEGHTATNAFAWARRMARWEARVMED